MQLRDYQEECVQRVLQSFEKNPRGRELIVLATGCGKTHVFNAVIRELSLQGVNALILAHRDELLEQASEKYSMVKPDAVIGKIGGGRHEYGGEVTVASVQTVSRPKHLKRLKAIGYGLIIVDEAHHVAAPGYRKVLEAFPNAFVLMVTATPDRLDGKPISSKPPLYSANIIDMIERGYVCDLRAIAIRTEVRLDDLHLQGGDYAVGELERAVDTPARNRRVVEAYREHAPGRKAICFCVTVQHAKSLAYAFNDVGINTAVIEGNTPLEERKQIYAQFRAGELQVLCNVQVLSEGWDEPTVDCVIMARPTKSRALYTQSVGRGTRLFPGKNDCLVLDLTDNCLSHRLSPQTLATNLEIDLQDGESMKEARERKKKEEVEKRVRRLKDKRHEDVAVNLLERLEWTLRDDGLYMMEIGSEKHRIALQPSKNSPGSYAVWARLAPFFIAQKWAGELPLADAQAFAEREARKLLGDNGALLVDRNAPWRLKPATEAQLATLARFGLEYTADITCGEASDLLDEAFRRRNTKKKGA